MNELLPGTKVMYAGYEFYVVRIEGWNEGLVLISRNGRVTADSVCVPRSRVTIVK